MEAASASSVQVAKVLVYPFDLLSCYKYWWATASKFFDRLVAQLLLAKK